jgi:hypothetical protein
MMVAARFQKCAFILGLLMPTGALATPLLDSDARCTHLIGLDEADQVREPKAASLNAIQDTRNIFIDRFGEPMFEKQVSGGVAIMWVIAGATSNPMARNVIIRIVRGTLRVTCGTSF